MLLYLYAFLTLIVVLIGHMLGNYDGLYVTVPLYDVAMHIGGGLGIGLFFCAVMVNRWPNRPHKKWLIIVGVVFVTGIFWELFEIYYDIAGYQLWTVPYYLDTLKDLVDDIIGGSLAAWIYLRHIQPQPATNNES